MITVQARCDSCEGTGLYQGMMERDGEAVICVNCGGKGYRIAKLTEFSGRKRRNNVTKIRNGSGTILDDTRNAKWITYDEFKKLIPDDYKQ